MIKNSKRNLKHSTWKLYMLLRLVEGHKSIKRDAIKIIITPFILVSVFIYSVQGIHLFSSLGIILLCYSILLFLYSSPHTACVINNNLLTAGFINSIGNPPIFLRKISNHTYPKLFVIHFYSNGLSFEKWLTNQALIENALNITISRFEIGYDKKNILIYGNEGHYTFPDNISWKNNYFVENDYEIILGESVYSHEKISLKMSPHILIGGSTGSGKTWLLKLILMQCIKKEHTVYISDFKGGVDYGEAWHKKTHFIIDEETLQETLQQLISELNQRKQILQTTRHSNIDEYNNAHSDKMSRIIFAFDELAEVFDKTGMNKEQKLVVEKIEKNITTIARLGRAFGIHLILSTQRPDANILSGQIKNNIDYRICGRADNVLSQIILDNILASINISKDSQGLFINQDGNTFKAFSFSENILNDFN